MKNLILLYFVVSAVMRLYAQCDGDIQGYINVAEEPGLSPNRHFMWGRATKLLADSHGCNDNMEEYAGGGDMTAMIYTTTWGGGFILPTTANIDGTLWNVHNGSFNSGYDPYSQWLAIDAVAELVKQSYPNYIDAQGRFIIDIVVPCRVDGIFHNNQYTYYHLDLIVWTDYRVNKAGGAYSCETDTVNFNTMYSSALPLNNLNITASAPYQATVSPGVYTAGNIGTDLDSAATYNVYGTYQIPTENMTPNQYPFAGALISCMWDFNSGNWTTSNAASVKTLTVNKTFDMPVYNKPSGSPAAAYPNPLYDNDPAITLNNYWNMSGYSLYQFNGGGVSFNSNNSQYEFSPSVGAGLHQITLDLNNQNKCYTIVQNNISVTQYPGTPAKPILDWDASFDYTTDSAIVTGGCLVPTYVEFPSGNIVTDQSLFYRHKWLCPNVSEDSMELFIQNPSANLTYYWKRSVNGLEEDLGTGTSKFIPREHPTVPNAANTYKEYIYFRSRNVVNNYSPWEYVELEYPIVPYSINSPNDSNSYVLLDTVCHDGGVSYQVFNNLLTNETFLGMTQTLNNPLQYERRYTYTDWDNSQTANNLATFVYNWSGTKIDTFYVTERGYLRRALNNCWANSDWCNCESRTLKVLPVKEPDIVSMDALEDTTLVGELAFFNASVNWSGTGTWYIDSMAPGHIGNAITFYGYGAEGFHDVWLHVEDSYGCSSDSTVEDFFFIKNLGYVVPPADTIQFVPDINPSLCLDTETGGNLVLTPNGDGLNDMISVCDVTRSYTMFIFDRWGNVLRTYETVPTINVDDLPSATYYYLISTSSGEVSGFIEIKK